jgi:hypothetical protein
MLGLVTWLGAMVLVISETVALRSYLELCCAAKCLPPWNGGCSMVVVVS